MSSKVIIDSNGRPTDFRKKLNFVLGFVPWISNLILLMGVDNKTD